MSIFGLDSPEIGDAYKTAQHEPGGWLILHYTSRDAIDLHASGIGGPAQLAAAIGKVKGQAPLYAFLKFNGSGIVCRFIPEGTSRLLQARTTVHFQTILEHFSPHDAILKATSPSDFTDARLSAVIDTPIDDAMVSPPSSPENVSLPVKNGTSPKVYTDERSLTEAETPQSSNPEVSNILARLAHRKSNPLSPSQLAFQNMMSTSFESSQDVSAPKDSNATQERELLPPVDLGSRLEFIPGLGPTWNAEEEKQTHDMVPTLHRDKNSGDYMRSSFGYEAASRPMTSDSATSNGYKKPKIRFFTRAVAEAEAFYAERDARARLPANVRMKQHDADLVKLKEPKLPSRSSRRPKTRDSEQANFHHHSRSTSSTKPFTVDISTKTLPEGELSHIASLTNASEIQAPVSSPVSTSQARTVKSGNGHEAKATEVAPIPANEESEPEPVKKPAPMTQERMRLLKAMQMRRKQQEGSKAAAGATEAAKVDSVTDHVIPAPVEEMIMADSGTDAEGMNSNGASAETESTSSGSPRNGVDSEDGTTVKGESPVGPSSVASKQDLNSNEAQLNGGGSSFPGLLARTQNETTRADPHPDDPRSTAVVTPLSIDSNDSFIDELQDAKVSEATAVSVPQTPLATNANSNANSPVASRSPPSQFAHDAAAAQSELYRSASKNSGTGLSPEAIVAGKALSPPTLINIPRSSASKRTNVSSGISRRIQALEERSQRSESPSPAPSRSPAVLGLPASFLSTPAHNLAAHNHSRNVSVTSRPSSKASSTRQGTIRGFFRPLDPIEDMTPRISTEIPSHVSVTARIIRPERQRSPEKSSTRRKVEPEFQQSHVIVEHQDSTRETSKRESAASRQSIRRLDRPASTTSAARPDSRGSSLSQIVGAGKNSMDLGFRFMGRKRSDSKSPTLTEKAMTSVGSLERVEEDQAEKKQSRTSRFFKRMSVLSHPSRSNANASDPSKPKLDNREVKTSHQHVRLSKYIVGDLNVQFPDTLFWKRRWVEVDGLGNLTLTGSQRGDVRATPKKYHLSSFLHPTIPSPDRQELPHSVVMEFVNGGTLQLASDDRVSQTQVFRKLSDAHNTWTT